VEVRPFTGFSEQRAHALSLARGRWVLSLDADEAVAPELAAAVRGVVEGPTAAAPDGPVGFRIARRSSFLGEWMRHGGWYPGYQLRLFRRDRASVSRSRVHEGYLVDGPVGILPGDILHRSHDDLEDSLEKSNRYSSLEALDRLSRGPVAFGAVLAHAVGAFLDQYVRRGGFRDGARGFLNAWVHAFTKLSLYAKLWDAGRRGPDALADPYPARGGKGREAHGCREGAAEEADAEASAR
jgi:hypothetical protein